MSFSGEINVILNLSSCNARDTQKAIVLDLRQDRLAMNIPRSSK